MIEFLLLCIVIQLACITWCLGDVIQELRSHGADEKEPHGNA